MKELQQGSTEPAPTSMADRVKLVTSTCDLAVKMALGLGVLLTMGYCSLSIHFYPSGLTFGDALFFLAIAGTFGFLHMIVCGTGFLFVDSVMQLCGVKVQRLCNPEVKPPKKSKQDVVLERAILIGFASMSALILASIGFKTRSWLVGLVPVAVGVLLCIAKTLYVSDRATVDDRKKGIPVLSATGVVLVPFILGFSFLNWEIDSVMQAYSLKADNVTLKVSEENFEALQGASDVWQIPLHQCESSGTGQYRIVHGVNLLWHGVGDRSLVSISAPVGTHGSPPSASVELKRDAVFAIRGTREASANCRAVPRGSFL